MRVSEMTEDELIGQLERNYSPIVSHKIVEDKLYLIRVDSDSNSREFCNLGTIYSAHRDYCPDGKRISDIDLDEIDNYFFRVINCYEHGGITVSTSKHYSQPFDSGTFGIIAVSKEDVLKEYGKIDDNVRETVYQVLDGEIEALDKDFNSGVYGYEIYSLTRNPDDNELFDDYELEDSCYGYYCDEEEIYNEIM